MRQIITVFMLAGFMLVGAVARAADAPPQSASGIPLDAPWKVKLYAFAQANFHHPAWGWQHSERNYRLAMEFARGDGLKVDADVVFAAAMLHDMAAFPPWSKQGMEHGDRAAETSGDVLRDAGFPMEKLGAVQAAERGHMYYSEAKTPEAIVLHDADSIDFLGTMGAVRMLALTGESKPDVRGAIKALRGFIDKIPPKLITKTAQRVGEERVAELKRLLDQFDAESYGGTAT
jgi:uncharacterized protein